MCNSIAGNSKFCMGYSSCLYCLTVNLLVISFFAIPNYRQPELQVIRDTGNISAGWLFCRNLNGAVGLQQKVGFAGLVCLWWDEKEVTNAWSNKKLVFLLWPVSCLAHLLCIRTCGCSAAVPNISHFLELAIRLVEILLFVVDPYPFTGHFSGKLNYSVPSMFGTTGWTTRTSEM